MERWFINLKKRLKRETAVEISLPVEHLRWLVERMNILEKCCDAESNLREKHSQLLRAEGMSQHGGRANAFYAAQTKLRDLLQLLQGHDMTPDPGDHLLDRMGR